MATPYQKAIWNQQKKELKQDYEYAGWQRDYQADQLKTGTMNNMLSRNMARSSVLGSTINQGMVPIEKQYSQAGQSYQNALARLALEQKYAGRGGGGGGRVPTADPPALSTPGPASSPSLYQAATTGVVPWQAAIAYTQPSPNSNPATYTAPKPQTQYDWWRLNH
jgi:hypothetical protein